MSGFLPVAEMTTEQRAQVETLLGREPRGLEGVAAWSLDGEPAVIQVSSLVDEKPFPTLYWLIDKSLSYKIDRVEARGLIKEFQERIDADLALQAALKKDHTKYIERRNSLMSDEVRLKLEQLGYFDALSARGIGGIANFTRIRCFHTYYGAHLVEPNTIGAMLDAYWAASEV